MAATWRVNASTFNQNSLVFCVNFWDFLPVIAFIFTNNNFIVIVFMNSEPLRVPQAKLTIFIFPYREVRVELDIRTLVAFGLLVIVDNHFAGVVVKTTSRLWRIWSQYEQLQP